MLRGQGGKRGCVHGDHSTFCVYLYRKTAIGEMVGQYCCSRSNAQRTNIRGQRPYIWKPLCRPLQERGVRSAWENELRAYRSYRAYRVYTRQQKNHGQAYTYAHKHKNASTYFVTPTDNTQRVTITYGTSHKRDRHNTKNTTTPCGVSEVIFETKFGDKRRSSPE